MKKYLNAILDYLVNILNTKTYSFTQLQFEIEIDSSTIIYLLNYRLFLYDFPIGQYTNSSPLFFDSFFFFFIGHSIFFFFFIIQVAKTKRIDYNNDKFLYLFLEKNCTIIYLLKTNI